MYPNPTVPIPKPDKLEEMVSLSSQLSKGMPFVRVDLYALPQLKFGELTFFPEGATGRIFPEIWNKNFGDLITLCKY